MSTAATGSNAPARAGPQGSGAGRREAYRRAILKAAERAFAERGYDATKVQDLARDAGVSLTTLYGVFPGKWEIFCALQEARLESLLAEVLTSGPMPADPFDRLCHGIERYLRFHMGHPDFLRVELREGVPWGTTDELRTPQQTRAWRQGLELMTRAFAEGIGAGVFVEDDPETFARTATAMSQVRLALWHRRGGRPDPDEVVARTLTQMVRAFVRPARCEEFLARVACRRTP